MQQTRHSFRLAASHTAGIEPLLPAKKDLEDFLHDKGLNAKVLIVNRADQGTYPILYIRPKGETKKEDIIAALCENERNVGRDISNICFKSILSKLENGAYTVTGVALISNQNAVARLTKSLLSPPAPH